MNPIRTRLSALTAVLAITLGGAAVATAQASEGGDHHAAETNLADSFSKVTRNTDWQLTSMLKLNFPTFHTEGIAFTPLVTAIDLATPWTRHTIFHGNCDATHQCSGADGVHLWGSGESL